MQPGSSDPDRNMAVLIQMTAREDVTYWPGHCRSDADQTQLLEP